MSCLHCDKYHASKDLVPYRWKNANILISACDTHLGEVFHALNSAQMSEPSAEEAGEEAGVHFAVEAFLFGGEYRTAKLDSAQAAYECFAQAAADQNTSNAALTLVLKKPHPKRVQLLMHYNPNDPR